MRYKILVFLLAIWGIARFCHYQTDGFRMSKLVDNTTPLLNQLPSTLQPEEKNTLDQLLSQRFTYLGRGKQSFAFVSEDGKTVLKFFNNRTQRRLKWHHSKEAKHKLCKVFESYQIAYEKLREETGLLYFHPQRGIDQFAPVTLIDKLGIAHTLDLNTHGFLLQKRAILAYDFLNSRSHDEERKAAIQALVDLLRTKMQRGISDHDPLIRANIGFEGDRPIQIDVGPLAYDSALLNKENQKIELRKMTLSLKHWLETHYPEQVNTLNEAIDQ